MLKMLPGQNRIRTAAGGRHLTEGTKLNCRLELNGSAGPNQGSVRFSWLWKCERSDSSRHRPSAVAPRHDVSTERQPRSSGVDLSE